jgi:hypothetical protein
MSWVEDIFETDIYMAIRPILVMEALKRRHQLESYNIRTYLDIPAMSNTNNPSGDQAHDVF